MKSRRWQIGAVFSHLFDWSIVNSVIIYQTYHPSFCNVDAKQLLLNQLTAAIINNSPFPSSSVGRIGQNCLRSDWALGHWPKRGTARRLCVAHFGDNQAHCKHKTFCFCSACKVHLHPYCFERYHSIQWFVITKVLLELNVTLHDFLYHLCNAVQSVSLFLWKSHHIFSVLSFYFSSFLA